MSVNWEFKKELRRKTNQKTSEPHTQLYKTDRELKKKDNINKTFVSLVQKQDFNL